MAGRTTWRNQWVYPMVLLGFLGLGAVAVLFSIDHYLDDAGFTDPITHYWSFNDEAVSNSIGVLSSIIAAVLGIVLTVVSIVVQLAATRFSPAVTEMFFRDRTNRAIMAVYVIGCVMGFWTAFGVNTGWVPRVSLTVMLATSTLGFLVMAPYFAYVFRFLSPESVVVRIEREAKRVAIGESERPRISPDERQRQSLALTEQLTDIAINSISQKDKIIATASVDALREVTVAYLADKPDRDDPWYRVDRVITENPDFASMAEDSVADLGAEGVWFEFKQLRQYQAIYTEALGTMRDINYVIAINTRLIAEAALANDEAEALELAVKFFNTYLRATLNQNDVRTAYTILNQYRIMAEAVLRAGRSELAVRIATHIKYYGHISYHKSLAFVSETVAYDLGQLCEFAHDIESPVEEQLLGVFLEVDASRAEGEIQEASLRGVRKAQVKLATYYLMTGAEALARRVWDDMRHESAERLRSIRDEMLSIETKDFWEISDRGGNFDYLEPARKEMLKVFFGWFAETSGELKTVSLDVPDGSRAIAKELVKP
jgi:hypothetical protein